MIITPGESGIFAQSGKRHPRWLALLPFKTDPDVVVDAFGELAQKPFDPRSRVYRMRGRGDLEPARDVSSHGIDDHLDRPIREFDLRNQALVANEVFCIGRNAGLTIMPISPFETNHHADSKFAGELDARIGQLLMPAADCGPQIGIGDGERHAVLHLSDQAAPFVGHMVRDDDSGAVRSEKADHLVEDEPLFVINGTLPTAYAMSPQHKLPPRPVKELDVVMQIARPTKGNKGGADIELVGNGD